MDYAVSREGRTLVTLHEGTETTACDVATEQLAESLREIADAGTVSDWSIDEAEVYEYPNAPFDPYTVTVAFTVTVVVAAETAAEAEERGASVIDEALADADVEAVSYTSSPATTAV